MGDQALTNFQREVANVFFALPESAGYLLAGFSSASTTRSTLETEPVDGSV
jgi:hypothetical protein